METGISISAISQYESLRATPPLSKAKLLSEKLDRPIDYLFSKTLKVFAREVRREGYFNIQGQG